MSSVTIPDSVTSIEAYVFYGCVSLTEIIMPNSITSIGDNAFVNCSNLINISFGSNVSLLGENIFQNCVKIEKITISTLIPPVLGINAFEGVSPSFKIYVPFDSVEAYKAATEWKNYNLNIQKFSQIESIIITGSSHISTPFGTGFTSPYTAEVKPLFETNPNVTWKLSGGFPTDKIMINKDGVLTISNDVPIGSYNLTITATSVYDEEFASQNVTIEIVWNGDNTLGIIIGCSVAGVALLGVVITGIIFGVKKHHKNKK